MRAIANKTMTFAMVVGAAMLVSACGSSETAAPAENTTMTEMNAMEPMEGSMNDMTAMDGAMGAEANMAMDNAGMADNASNGM